MRRRVAGTLVLLLTIALTYALSNALGSLPALGPLLDPVNGAIAGTDASERDLSRHLKCTSLQAPVAVYWEERLVPHVVAANDHDLYFIQGYIHASLRLWQMDMQTRAAAGRVSEVAGSKAVDFDVQQRRKGMVYAAEQSLKAMEAEPRTRGMLNAYTEGVNYYISSLNFRRYPVEYKLMGFAPERWTNLKCALLLKYMADDLTGYTEDFPLSVLRSHLDTATFGLLYPEKIAGSQPVIPAGTRFGPASAAVPVVPGADVFPLFPAGQTTFAPSGMLSADGIGSNNWAISGARSATGAAILCNDPHLGLNLPSLWFEIQLQAPGINAYGVSLPGAPGIVIGFNDSVSWGFTNNYRDVKDYYAITPAGKDHYLFDGKPVAFTKRVEQIKIKGGDAVADTVLYTRHGPVQYDASHKDPAGTGGQYAMCWMAHRPTNELLSLYLLNRATSYQLFTEAIQHFECPAQNFVFADRQGNIAMWGQGRFVNKWREQGRYVMEGKDSRTLWGADIPMAENPHTYNPPEGYVVSANQSVTDNTYPYYYNGTFYEFRSWLIHEQIASVTDVAGMMRLQNDYQSWLLRYFRKAAGQVADGPATERFQHFGNKNDRPDELLPASRMATAWQLAWYFFYKNVWQDDFGQYPAAIWPSAERTMQLLADTSLRFYDDTRTREREGFSDMVYRSMQQASDSMERVQKQTGLEWYRVKNTTVRHLARIPAFSYDQLAIGGWGNTINACKNNHGPSWRMIVSMGKDSISAWGIYPGGQSGHPGSRHYADFLQQWVEGRYNKLVFLPAGTTGAPQDMPHRWLLNP